ncbi:MAG TPA: porin, partial [Candidatus Poseidoniia archaeon]|nr:porin [Candidatus Poseidoniia archaeon]
VEALQRKMQAIMKAFNERIDALEAELELLKSEAAGSPELDERVAQLEEAAEDAEEEAANDFGVFWNNSLRLETKDGHFKLRLGGRIQQDWVWFDEDRDLRLLWNPLTRTGFSNNLQDGAEFRRVYLDFSGQVYDDLEFKIQHDYADGDVDFKDVYIAMRNVPVVGKVKVGHFKEPFSLNELTSDNDTTLMERGLPNMFAPSRSTGIGIANTAFDDRLTWATGIFRDVDSYGDGAADGNYIVTSRVTGLPWYEEGGRRLFHLGLSYSHRNTDAVIRIRHRPEAHLANVRFLDTGPFFADDENRYSLEAALVHGPFSLQGEYMASKIDTRRHGDVDFEGYYVFASYILTGENRRYNNSTGTFRSVRPNRNFSISSENRGWGAWELALRYSSLDLNDSSVSGGEEDNITLGLNWYLNPNARWMLNYVHADVDHVLYSGDVDILQTRFQVNF